MRQKGRAETAVRKTWPIISGFEEDHEPGHVSGVYELRMTKGNSQQGNRDPNPTITSPSRPARPPGTGLPTAGLDHRLAKWDHASGGITSRLGSLAVFRGFSQQGLESQRPPPGPLGFLREHGIGDSTPGRCSGQWRPFGELLLSWFCSWRLFCPHPGVPRTRAWCTTSTSAFKSWR